MPQAQVINFGEDPYANAMGSFAKSFLGELNQKSGQRRNEAIFSKIQEKYGKDANPEDIFRDVANAEGLDQDYKRNKLKEITEYASLSTKRNITPYQEAILDIRNEELNLKKTKSQENADKGLTAYQQKILANQEVRLENERKRLEISAQKQDKQLPGQIAKFTSDRLKEAELRWPIQDVTAMNNAIEQLMTGKEPLGANAAFQQAFDLVEQRREIINTAKITPRPTSWVGSPTEKELLKNRDKAYEDLKKLYDEQGINSQKDLRAIAEKYGWEKDEITAMLRRIFKESGQKFKEPKQKEPLDITDSILYG